MLRIISIFILMYFLLAKPTIAQVVTEGIRADVIKPRVEVVQSALQLTGSIEAINNTDLAVQQAGAVLALFAEQGDNVKKGDKLLELESTIAQYRLNELQALLSVTQIEHEEAKRLYDEVLALSKTQFVAETLLAERKAFVARANAAVIRQRAAMDLQKEVLKRFTLYAPFDGVIAMRSADIGEWVVPQQPVFNLVSNGQLRLRVALPQEYYARFNDKPGMATITPDFDGATQLQLPVTGLVAVTDPNTRTVIALIDLPASNALIAGMSASVRLEIAEAGETLIWLPDTAIKSHPDGGSSVFAIENGKAKRYVVQIGKKQGDDVAVVGAPPELNYVIKGVELMQDGQDVTANLVDAASGVNGAQQ